MAFLTDHQRRAFEELQREHGDPDHHGIEMTKEPYGLLKMHWHANRSSLGRELGQDRVIIIRPDGTRVTWDSHWTERLRLVGT